jgi:hypothetical protein
VKSMKSKMRGTVLLALLALAAVTGSRPVAAADKLPHAEITIDNFSFGPESLSVNRHRGDVGESR